MSECGDIAALLHDNSRVVIVAPHPDDETLATGGLIQQALAARAKVSVVLLTDGDMNPWPQRVTERKIVVTPADRERWGRRRRKEAVAALAQLGLDKGDVVHLGLPDLGLVRMIEADVAGAIEPLAAIFRNVRPTLVAAPSLHDTHPDHGAAHVMTSLALSRSGGAVHCLSYLVHGRSARSGATLPLDAAMHTRKLDALKQHETQMLLSRARMLRYAERSECLGAEDSASSPHDLDATTTLPWRLSAALLPFVSLFLVTRDASERLSPVGDRHASATDARRCVRLDDGRLELRLPSPLASGGPIFARLESRLPSPWIYDRWGWARLA